LQFEPQSRSFTVWERPLALAESQTYIGLPFTLGIDLIVVSPRDAGFELADYADAPGPLRVYRRHREIGSGASRTDRLSVDIHGLPFRLSTAFYAPPEPGEEEGVVIELCIEYGYWELNAEFSPGKIQHGTA